MLDQPGGRSRRNRLALAGTTTYAATVANAVLLLANVVIVSRALGPSGRGEVTFLGTLAALTAFVAALSVDEASANLVGRLPQARRAIATNAVVLSLVLGIAGSAVVYGLIAFLPALRGGVSLDLLSIALAAVPMIICQAYLTMLVRADYGFAVANATMLVTPVINITVNALMAALGFITVGTALITSIASQVVATAVLARYVARRLTGFGRPDLRLALGALGFGLKTHGSASLSAGNLRLDNLLLGILVGSRELGLYTVAVAWFESMFLLPTALTHVLRPDQVRSSPDEARRRVTKVVRITMLATVLPVVGLVLAAPLLCVMVFGEEFRGAALPLQLLAPGAFGIVALKLLGNTLVAQRRPLPETAAIGTAFLATVLLDVILIPRHGAVGAALASGLAYTVAGVAIGVIFSRVMHGRKGDYLPRVQDLSDARAELRALVRGSRSRAHASADPPKLS